MAFNYQLVDRFLSPDRIIAFDPSFLPKSGKCTDGVGRFWSGCAGQVKPGLEICGLAAVDLQDKTALHLEAIQVVDKHEEETMLDYYTSCILSQSSILRKVSKYVAVDAYFSKYQFVNDLTASG